MASTPTLATSRIERFPSSPARLWPRRALLSSAHRLCLMPHMPGANVDGVWNLVLAGRDCNRGATINESFLIPLMGTIDSNVNLTSRALPHQRIQPKSIPLAGHAAKFSQQVPQLVPEADI